MNLKKQTVLIQYMLSSPNVFQLCAAIIQPEFFAPELMNVVKFIKKYHSDHNALPSVELIDAETDMTLTVKDLTKDESEYCLKSIEQFCQDKALEHAIYKSVESMHDGDRSAIRRIIDDALTVSLQKNVGLDYFNNIEERIKRTFDEMNIHSTGWDSLDEILFGGIVRRELLIFSAPSGGGKSVAMVNLGANFIMAGLNVAVITLELSQDLSASRIDSIFSGVGRMQLKDQANVVAKMVKRKHYDGEYGQLFIKFMPSGSACDDIRAYLKELEVATGVIPDMIIVDYLDLMQPNSKQHGDNVFLKDKYVSEELRNLGSDYDAFMISASQLNRSGVNQEKPDETMIGGGKSKFDTCDTWISIVSNEVMKAKNNVIFYPMKTRNSDGKGKACTMYWNPVSLKITDVGGNAVTPMRQMIANHRKKVGLNTSDASNMQSITDCNTPKMSDEDRHDLNIIEKVAEEGDLLGMDWNKL